MATDQQINNLLQEIDANQTTIDTNIKKKLLSLQNNNAVFTEALLKRIRSIMQLIQQLKPKFADNADKLRQKQEELDKCNEAIQKYQSEIRTLNEQQSSQTQDMSQKQLEIESLNTRITELQQQIEELQGKIQEFQSKQDSDLEDDTELNAELAQNEARLREQLKPTDNNTPSNPSELYLNAIEEELQALLNSNQAGGKRRRKTKKMRGGYLYSRKSNSNSSSMSRSNSKSRSKSRTKSKTRSKKN